MRYVIGVVGAVLVAACAFPDAPPTSVEIQFHEHIVGFFGDSSIIVNQDKLRVSQYGPSGQPESSTKVETIYSVVRNFNYRSNRYSDLLDYHDYAGIFIRGNGLYLTPTPRNDIYFPYRRFDLVFHQFTETGLRAQEPNMSEDDGILYQCSQGIETITVLPDGPALLSNAQGAGGYCACYACMVTLGPKWLLFNHYNTGYIQYRVIDSSGATSLATTSAVLAGTYHVHSLGNVPYALDSSGTVTVPAEFDPAGKLTEVFNRLRVHVTGNFGEIEPTQGLFIAQDSLRSLSTWEVMHTPFDFPP